MGVGTGIIPSINLSRGTLLMILVLLGTFHIEFKRPLIEIDKLCRNGQLQETIVIQNGHTLFESSYFDMRPFITPNDLDKLYDDARIIITHAGTGSIIKGLKKGKKIVAIPRLKKYGEHIDDHQLEILNEFVALGYILPWNENDHLEKIMLEIINFNPKPYISRKKDIEEFLKNYIDSL